MARTTYFLRPETLQDVLDRHHLTHQRFADHLGLSRSYWSQVFNRPRHLTPMLRQCLLGSRWVPFEYLVELVPGAWVDVTLYWQHWARESPSAQRLTAAVKAAAHERLIQVQAGALA